VTIHRYVYACVHNKKCNPGVGSCSKLGGGYLSYQDTFVWEKLHSFGVTVKNWGAPAPFSAAYAGLLQFI